jgi:hypothetical protein
MMSRHLFLILALGLAAGQVHAVDQWSGTGPIVSGTGNRVIHALAVSPDGGTVYAGAGSGTVFVYVHADTVPDAFAFVDRTDVALSTLTTSDPITVSGINTATSISVSGGDYQVNGLAWTTADGVVNNGDTVAVRHVSGGNHGVTVDTVLSIGGVSDTFSSTTLAAPIHGACGGANGTPAATAPSINLCDSGVASNVTGNGPWSWSCGGQNGGATANCSAPLLVPPTITSGAPVNGMLGVAYSSGIAATGQGTLVFGASGLPPGLSIDAGSGVITGTPTAPGIYPVTVGVSGAGGTVNAEYTIMISAPTTFSGPTATGTGIATATASGGGPVCGFVAAQFIPLSSVPVAPPGGVGFPHGLFDFTLGGCTPGATISLNIEYPAPLPAGTTYWKYGPTPTDASYHWYTIASTVSGHTASFSIVDGGLGDDDLTPNGTLVDQGGPGQYAGAAAIPAMSERGLGLLSLLLAACAVTAMRRRKA